jgi:hypothetical protein
MFIILNHFFVAEPTKVYLDDVFNPVAFLKDNGVPGSLNKAFLPDDGVPSNPWDVSGLAL